MARFDVYRNTAGEGCLINIQSDLLDGLNTRIVVPLLPLADAPKAAQSLNPVFEVEGTELVMVTQFMAAVPQGELEAPIGNLANQHQEISLALDMLFLGF